MDAGDQRAHAIRLLSEPLWLALGIVDENGVPSLSYVPFAPVEGALGIVVSRLSAHTVSLLARRPASILLVDPGAEPRDAYQRARLTVGVIPKPQAGGSAKAEAVWSALEARQGETVRVLHALPDFEAISLEPSGGRLVLGFASAHDLEAAALVDLVRAAG
jgi:putative heme iron utilization protein